MKPETGESAGLTDGVVRLRRVEPERDADVALPWYRDPVVLWGSEGSRQPFDRARVVRMYEVLQSRGEAYLVEVATETGWVPVGDATLTPDSLPIVVGAADWRGRGLGRRILALLIGRARALGYTHLAVHQIFVDNTASRRLYEGAGFRPVDEGVQPDGRRWRAYRLDLEA